MKNLSRFEMHAIAAALAMAAAANARAEEVRTGKRLRTTDGFQTYDQQTIDSSGTFLIGELERLDQRLHMPLATVTWSRDIKLREDVTIADEQTSFTNSSFAAAGGASPNGKSWIGKDATAIAGLSLDIGKTMHPLTLWGQELSWTLPELESAQKVGRPVDVQKFNGMNLKYQMDVDEMVYIGDTIIGATGLVNDANASLGNAPTGTWATATADQILTDINEVLQRAWDASAFAVCPTRLLLPPLKFALLTTRLISTAGSISILEYVRQNCISNANNGRPLEILPLKWLTGRGAAGVDRMVAYTPDTDEYVRFPLVGLQRTPLEYRGLRQLTTYYGRLGQVEVVYPETVAYSDGI